MLKNIIVKAIVLCSLAFLVACGDDADAFLPACGDDDGDSATYSDASSSSVKSSSSEKASSSSERAKLSSSVAPEQSSSSLTPKQSSSSSSSKQSSSSITLEQLSSDSEWTGAYFTDPRDGKTYKTVTIGTQTWMAENLNYKTVDSYCYNDNESNCTKYGRLYTWAAAMDSVGTWSTNSKGCGYYGTTCSPTYPVRGICPEGWHLPTKAEFETLFTAVGGQSTAGKMLKSTSGWNGSGNGTDAYAFSALPSGLRYYNGDWDFDDEGYTADFWSSTELNSVDAYGMYLSYTGDSAYLGNNLKYIGFSVRCLKD